MKPFQPLPEKKKGGHWTKKRRRLASKRRREYLGRIRDRQCPNCGRLSDECNGNCIFL